MVHPGKARQGELNLARLRAPRDRTQPHDSPTAFIPVLSQPPPSQAHAIGLPRMARAPPKLAGAPVNTMLFRCALARRCDSDASGHADHVPRSAAGNWGTVTTRSRLALAVLFVQDRTHTHRRDPPTCTTKSPSSPPVLPGCALADWQAWQVHDAADVGRQRYGTFRLNFHRFDRFELDLRGHTQPQGAAFSCLRLRWAYMVLI